MPEENAQTTSRLKVGLIQLQPTRDVAANLVDVLAAVTEASRKGADLIVIPENALCIGSNKEMRAAAVTIDSPEILAIRKAARETKSVVVLGGFKQRSDRPKLQNTALVIDADGETHGSYVKIHLFNAVVSGAVFRASDVEDPGTQMVIVEVKGVKVGLSICFDVRFPEMYRQMALAGAQVLLVPSAFTRVTGEAHWETLLRARAIENAAYVVASATIASADSFEAGFETYGHAMAIDPWGRVVANLGDADFAVKVVELDMALVFETRQNMPVLNSVMPNVYATQAVLLLTRKTNCGEVRGQC